MAGDKQAQVDVLKVLVGLAGLTAGAVYLLTRKEPAPTPKTSPSPPLPGPGTSLADLTLLPAGSSPPMDPVRGVVPISIPSLDDNLTIDEIDAVAYALARETDAANLINFAGTFFPYHIITASLLIAKAKVLRLQPGDPLRNQIEDAVRQPVDLRQLASMMLPEFPIHALLLEEKAKASRATSSLNGIHIVSATTASPSGTG